MTSETIITELSNNIYFKIVNTLIDNNLTISIYDNCTHGMLSTFFTNNKNFSKVYKGALSAYCEDIDLLESVINKSDYIDISSKESAKEMSIICKKLYNSKISIGLIGNLHNNDTIFYSILINHQFFCGNFNIPCMYGETVLDRKFYVVSKIGHELLKLFKTELNIENMSIINNRFKVGDIVQHFKREFINDKNSKEYLYQILSLAIDTETNELTVVYKALYNDSIFVRPLNSFNSEVDHEKYPNVIQKYRFEVYTNNL